MVCWVQSIAHDPARAWQGRVVIGVWKRTKLSQNSLSGLMGLVSLIIVIGDGVLCDEGLAVLCVDHGRPEHRSIAGLE